MSNRKILYGYQIRRGELTTVSKEADTVRQIATLYLNGLSYQKISDTLNGDRIPFSGEAPLWNKHKVKRLLENPRYTGTDGYPPILEREAFDAIQSMIWGKTSHYAKAEKRPVLQLKEYLLCGSCHGRLLGMGGKNQKPDTLYLRCERCGMLVTIPDSDLLAEAARQMAEYDAPPEEPYTPSGEVVRLINAINRRLEHPDKPEDVVSLILQGVSARYDCCSAPTEHDTSHRLTEVDFKHFGRAVSHIVIAANNSVTIQFK